MDFDRFHSLARSFGVPSPRRTLVRLLAGTALVGVLASGNSSGVAGKNARKRRRRKAKAKVKALKRCRRNRPADTSYTPTVVCQDGLCEPPSVETCSSSDGFCAQSWATCLEMIDCGCFVTVENESICGNLLHFAGCPPANGCASSDDCADVEFCVNLDCCPHGKQVCVPLCVPPN